MGSPDTGRFAPESVASILLDSSQGTGRGGERFPRLRLCGTALAGATLGVAVGAVVGVGLWGPPIESIATPEAIGFIGKVSGFFGLPAAGWGAVLYYAEH